MKRQVMFTALVLMTSGAAHAFTEEQIKVIEIVELAYFAGGGNCPRFTVDQAETGNELMRAGLLGPSVALSAAWTAVINKMMDGFSAEYTKDPSKFCNDAWTRLGPKGTYKRPGKFPMLNLCGAVSGEGPERATLICDEAK